MDVQEWIDQLALEPHPEGGFYKSTYESSLWTEADQGERKLYTSIYFLLRSEDVSHFHRLKSDELWYFHAGSSITIHMLHTDGTYQEVKLGLDVKRGEVPQFVVPKDTIFGSTVDQPDTFSLAGCMVSPGFDFADFELLSQQELLPHYPDQAEEIKKLAIDK